MGSKQIYRRYDHKKTTIADSETDYEIMANDLNGRVKTIFFAQIINTGTSGDISVKFVSTDDTAIVLGPGEDIVMTDLLDWNYIYLTNASGAGIVYEAIVKGD